MSYGFLLYNTNGKLVANSNDFNYGLITEGSLYCNATWTTLSWSDTGEIPLVFLKFDNVSAPVNRFVAVYNITASGALIGIFDTVPTNGRLSQITGTVDYRIYKTFKSFGDPIGQEWGMKIYNSAGEKTFDSRYKIPLITNVLTLPAVGLPDDFSIPTTVVAIPSGFSNGVWISINSFGGFRGSQFNGTTAAMCLGAVGTGTAGGVPYIIGTFGHQPGGGFSGQNTFDRDKQLFVMPV